MRWACVILFVLFSEIFVSGQPADNSKCGGTLCDTQIRCETTGQDEKCREPKTVTEEQLRIYRENAIKIARRYPREAGSSSTHAEYDCGNNNTYIIDINEFCQLFKNTVEPEEGSPRSYYEPEYVLPTPYFEVVKKVE